MITGIGPEAVTGRMSAVSGTVSGTLQPDGSTLYNKRTTKAFRDVTLNGRSVKTYGVIEVSIKENGYGYVMTTKNPDDDEQITLPDGSSITYVSFGIITIN